MSEMLLLVEPQIPALRRYARALVPDRSGPSSLQLRPLADAVRRQVNSTL